MFSRIYLKLYFSFLVIFLVTLVVVLTLAAAFYSRNFRNELENVFISHARFFSTQYSQNCGEMNTETCGSFVRSLGQVEGFHFWVVDQNATVLQSLETNPLQLTRAEINEAASGDPSIIYRTHGHPMIVISIPSVDERYLVMQSTFPHRRRRLARFPLGASLIVSGGLIALMVLPLSLRITRPLRKLHQLAQQWAEGKLDQRAKIRGSDEIAQLGSVFNLMAANLEQSLQTRKEFLALISHELKSPLARMRIALELISDRHANDSNTVKILDEMKKEIDESEKLIEQLLILSKVEMTLPSTVNEVVDIAVLIRRSVEQIAPLAASANVTIAMPDSNRISNLKTKGDPVQLQRALFNVVENAVKYSSSGAKVDIDALSENGKVMISVSDAGAGIAEDERGKIFEPFFRGASTDQKQGAGLGLFIARKIVELHNGKIFAKPVPAGATIIIELPSAQDGIH